MVCAEMVMGRNGHGRKCSWTEMVMGRNDPESFGTKRPGTLFSLFKVNPSGIIYPRRRSHFWKKTNNFPTLFLAQIFQGTTQNGIGYVYRTPYDTSRLLEYGMAVFALSVRGRRLDLDKSLVHSLFVVT